MPEILSTDGAQDKGQPQIPDSKIEVEKLPPILIVYRENDLYKNFVPQMAETLRGFGRQVEVHSFPAETEKEEIEKWSAENKGEFEGRYILPDITCQRGNVPSSQLDQNLDLLFDECAQRVVCGDRKLDYDIGESKMEEAKEVFVDLLKRILRDPKRMPEKVIVSLDHIFDHQPFLPASRRYDAEKKLDYEKAVETIKVKLGDKWNVLVSNYDGDATTSDGLKAEIVAEISIREWLEEAGLSPEQIIIFKNSKIDRKSMNQLIGEKNNWFIADRHSRYQAGKGGIEATLLRLPLVNFLTDAARNGLVDIGPEELGRALKVELEKGFAPKLAEPLKE